MCVVSLVFTRCGDICLCDLFWKSQTGRRMESDNGLFVSNFLWNIFCTIYYHKIFNYDITDGIFERTIYGRKCGKDINDKCCVSSIK